MVKHGNARKGFAKVDTEKFTFKCKQFDVMTEGTPASTKLLINGKVVTGVFYVESILSTKRVVKLIIGIYPGWCNLDVKEVKNQKDTEVKSNG